MNIESLCELVDPIISLEIEDAVLIIKFGNDVFDLFTDMDKRHGYFQLMDAVEDDDSIKVVLMLCKPDCLNEEAYKKFMETMCDTDVNLENIGDSFKFKESENRINQLNFQRYVIERRVASKKIFISGLRGTVVTPFFGEALASDLRYVSDDMHFSLAHKKYGLYPTGALAFFLPKYIGQGRSIELMLTVDSINAEQALNLGLINRILQTKDFESRCIQMAKEVSSLSMGTLSSTKLLSTSYKKELNEYFDTEETLISNWHAW